MMKSVPLPTGAFRVAGLLIVALAMTSAEAVAQRRPPPGRRPMPVRQSTVGDQREGRWFIDLRAGLAAPVGDFGSVASTGASFGFGFGQWLSEGGAFRFRTDVEFPRATTLEGGFVVGLEGPTWTMWHIDAGLMYDVTQGDGPLLLGIDMAVGGTLIDSGGDFQGLDVTQWYLSLTPGLVVGYAFSSTASFIVDGRHRFLIGTEDVFDTALPDAAENLGHVQFQAGFRILVGR